MAITVITINWKNLTNCVVFLAKEFNQEIAQN